MRPVSGQFLWGSDFPFIAPERCLAELDALDLPADVLDKLLRENALRILGALRREVASRGRAGGRRGAAVRREPTGGGAMAVAPLPVVPG